MNKSDQSLKNDLTTIVRYCITKSPGFASIALWIPYHISLADPHLIACTDGISIQVGGRFWDYSPAEQAFFIIHEVMHVALRHVQRRLRSYDPLLWNIATDGVINWALSQVNWLACPQEIVRLETLIDEEALKLHPIQQWTSEQVYHYLLQHPERVVELSMADLRQWSELGERGSDDCTHSKEVQDKIWRNRLIRAQTGDRWGSIFRHLQQDFPDTKTPWQHHLRRYLTQAMLPQRELNWSKPSRRSVSLSDQNIEVFEPGIRPKLSMKRAGIVIDTSGSIQDELLHLFVAEVQTIQTQTGCEIYLISADAQVQSEDWIRSYDPGIKTLMQTKQIQLKGGGCTDFRPALECLKPKAIDICIYLTDLMGTFPEKAPRYPIIWASTYPNRAAPFGRIIYLE